ncbi:MAG: exosortase family protein XrtG [Eubacteriales bacterium]|nr:exosortase family protein XrtG [Eubacteriales bacterium]MDD3290010.1 exosortase family protein XrtG [Eubacteriales bacterium]MDD3863568.1 exosortase family protein XrtG [Eubacteriales bacterium]MDD4445179.1 exosortase family protein XrtG [Eubacteriales bacterium]
MNYLVVALTVVWFYMMTVFKRARLDFWLFLVGSVGSFMLYIIWIQPILTAPLQKAVAAVAGLLGTWTGMYSSYFQYGILFIQTPEGSLSLYIDYECSGIIEIGAFAAMLWFFPVYRFFEKIVVSAAGILMVFMANVFRIFIICACIYFFGGDIYFYAHTIIGRLFFYACTILLYFYVFTKSHIVRQKIGRFNYDMAD